MYLTRLINLPIKQKKEAFLWLVNQFKNDLLDEVQLEKFILIYPEWVVGVSYVDDLKKAIAEYKAKNVNLTKIEKEEK